MGIIIAAIVVAVLAVWGISCQRRLTLMDENVDRAMAQLGIQLSARFNALTALLELTKGYAAHESQTLIETIKSRHIAITAASTPEEAREQEGIIREALSRVDGIAGRHPELKTDENYLKCMRILDISAKMVCTDCLLYNDSVSRFNRELRVFPTSLLAGVFGFRQREHLEAEEDETGLPGMG